MAWPRSVTSPSLDQCRSASGTNELGVGADYLTRDKVMQGDTLLSNLCRPLLYFLEETPEQKGIHDTHNSSCNRAFYESAGFGSRDGCHEILSGVLAPYGIRETDLPDTMDLFMNWYQTSSSEPGSLGYPSPVRETTSSSVRRWIASSVYRTVPTTSEANATHTTALRSS